jgi:hypothetical protein
MWATRIVVGGRPVEATKQARSIAAALSSHWLISQTCGDSMSMNLLAVKSLHSLQFSNNLASYFKNADNKL